MRGKNKLIRKAVSVVLGFLFVLAVMVSFFMAGLWLTAVSNAQPPPYQGYPDADYPSYYTQEQWHEDTSSYLWDLEQDMERAAEQYEYGTFDPIPQLDPHESALPSYLGPR